MNKYSVVRLDFSYFVRLHHIPITKRQVRGFHNKRKRIPFDSRNIFIYHVLCNSKLKEIHNK